MNSTALKQPVKPTVYKEPAERNAGLGFASSILNGNTIEGGLRSLTYKSIYASKLVEELDTMRNALIQPTPELLRISEFDVISSERVQQLHSEIEEVKNAKTARNHANDEKISQFNLSLDTELDTNKLVSEQYSSEVKKYYSDMIPDMNVSFNNSTHSVTKIKCPVDITRMEDVEGFDKSIYERAAERRELEEKKRQEEEALRILEEERKRQEAEAAQAAQAAQAAADLVVAETADTRMHLDEDYSSYSASPSMDQLSPVVQDSPYSQAQSPY